jgi:hypothetical protein
MKGKTVMIRPTSSRRMAIACLMPLAVLFSAAIARAEDAKPAADSNSAQTAAADRLESALKQTKTFYQRTDTPGQPTSFSVVVQDNQNRMSMMTFRTIDYSWKYPDGSPVELIAGFTQTIAQPKPSATVGAAVARYNDTQFFGGGTCNDNGVFSELAFFSDPTMAPDTVRFYMLSLHFFSQGLKDAIDPVIKAEAAEKK